MAIIKEFREFFLRHVQVSSGAKPDQEVGFNLQYFIGGIGQKFNRFLKGDFPNENVFKKLFQSITFKLNVEDTADNVNQGLVRIATDTEAEARTDNSTGTFTNVVQPHQLPNLVLHADSDDVVVGSPIILNGLILFALKRTIGGKFWRNFKIAINYDKSIVIGTGDTLELDGDDSTPGNNKVYGTNNIGIKGWYDIMPSGSIIMFNSITAPVGWNVCDGSNGTPDLRGKFIVSTGQNSTPASGDLNPTYALNDTGGENTHQLNVNELPQHSHGNLNIPRSLTNGSSYTVVNGAGTSGAFPVSLPLPATVFDGAGGTESTYSRHENRPTFYALTYIMKL
jgi:microcystin-dependent protein